MKGERGVLRIEGCCELRLQEKIYEKQILF